MKRRLFQATKHVGIGTISAGFETEENPYKHYHVVRCAPILRRHIMRFQEEGAISLLEAKGYRVEEVKYE